MRKSPSRFREITRNGSGVVPRDFTKTKGRAILTLAGALLALLAGCCPHKIFLDDVSYELQVRDGKKGVEGARVRVDSPELTAPPVGGVTDVRGRLALNFEMSAIAFRRSSEVLRPWLEVTVEKDGHETLKVALDRTQFIEDGGKLRRAEAVLLMRKLP